MLGMVKRDDIPGLSNYAGSEFIVGYLTYEEYISFFGDFNCTDAAQDCILSVTKLVNSGYSDGVNNFAHKGVYLPNEQNYSEVAGFKYSSFYTIEPKDLVPDDKIYYKVVIYSLHENYLKNYLLYWFSEGTLMYWIHKFYLTSV